MFREKTKLVLGRGEVYFDRFLGNTKDGERYLGNTPAFRIDREIKRVERMTSYRGQRQKRPGVVVEENISCTLTFDHMVTENIALWHGADPVTTSLGNGLIPYSETLVVKKDRYYQLGMAVNGFGLGYLDTLQVRLTNASGTILTVGVHYHADRELGRIQIPPSSPLADGTTIFVQYFKRPSPVTTMISNGENIIGALRYVSTNPHGPRCDYWFPQVRLTPRGAVDLKGDEFQQRSLDIEAIRLAPNLPLVYAIADKSEPLAITADTVLLRADTTLYRADSGAWE